jgi:hypothetical protein
MCTGFPRGLTSRVYRELHAHRVWSDANGKALIEAFSKSGMAHGVPLATTTEERCGAAGAFFLDVGISSTHHIARFFRLHEPLVGMPRAAAPVSAALQLPTRGGALVVAGAAEGAHTSIQGDQRAPTAKGFVPHRWPGYRLPRASDCDLWFKPISAME